MKIDTISRFSVLFLLVSSLFLLFGCGARVKLERNHDLQNFFGSWEARSAVVTNCDNKRERIEIIIPRYGQVNCQINPDGTFTLDINVNRDVTLQDDKSWFSMQHVLVHGGYKMFISGTYEYEDSIADFYNYNRERHFRSVLYTCGDYFYMTYTDEKQNQWEFQFEKTN